jgi:hypothetical protein
MQRNLVTNKNICKNIKIGNILSIENSLIDDKMNIKRENILSIENSLFDDKMNVKNNYNNKSNLKKIDSFGNKTQSFRNKFGNTESDEKNKIKS